MISNNYDDHGAQEALERKALNTAKDYETALKEVKEKIINASLIYETDLNDYTFVNMVDFIDEVLNKYK